MRPRIVCGIKASCAAILLACAGTAYPIDVYTEENAPFNYRDGEALTGISTEILNEMARRSGVALDMHLLSWARAYQIALSDSNACVFSTTRLPEREKQFKWIGPIATNKWALFARADLEKTIKSMADARPLRIGAISQDGKVTFLRSQGFANFDLIGNDELNLSKLNAGRIDLWVTGLYKGQELVAKAKSTRVKPVLIIKEVDYFLACNLATSDTELKALRQQLLVLRKEGYVKTVTDRYATWFRHQPSH